MSVETFNPSAAQVLRMSPAAVAHAQRQLTKRGALAFPCSEAERLLGQ